MLDIRCREHYAAVVAFAKKIGCYEAVMPEPAPDARWYCNANYDACTVQKNEGDVVTYVRLDTKEEKTAALADFKRNWKPRGWDPHDKQYLKSKLDHLDAYGEGEGESRVPGSAKCVVFQDSAPYSFGLNWLRRATPAEKERTGEDWIRWMVGGLIYHGPHDADGMVNGPTFTVSQEPCRGWSVHT